MREIIFIPFLLGGCMSIWNIQPNTLDLNKTVICKFDCRTIRVLEKPEFINAKIVDGNYSFLPINCFNAEIEKR